MKFLVIFVLSLLCVRAYRVPFVMDPVSSVSSEEIVLHPSGVNRPPILPIIGSISTPSSEEMLLYPPGVKSPPTSPNIASVSSASSEELLFYTAGSAVGEPQLSLAGLGVVSQPVLQAVTVPRYTSDLNSKSLLMQALAPQDVDVTNFGDLNTRSQGGKQLFVSYADLPPNNMELNFGSRGSIGDVGAQPQVTKVSSIGEQLKPVLKLFVGNGGQMLQSNEPALGYHYSVVDDGAQLNVTQDISNPKQVSPPVLKLLGGDGDQMPNNVDYYKYKV